MHSLFEAEEKKISVWILYVAGCDCDVVLQRTHHSHSHQLIMTTNRFGALRIKTEPAKSAYGW